MKLSTAGAAALIGLLVRTRRSRLKLAGKVAIVVGGSRGLGLQIAREAVRRGARIGICARDQTELEVAHRELSDGGATVATAICDVRDDASVKDAIAQLTSELGPVDVLFNVAGIIAVGPVEALDVGDFRDAIETNFFGALRGTLAVLPAMKARGTGRIVNVASIGGAIPVPHLLPYCASKFALVGFSEGLRAEVARTGITVITVIPGLMRTGSAPHALFAGQTKKEYALFALAAATPATSVSVEHAARMILNATERGSTRVVISWQAKLALYAYAVAPRIVGSALALTGYFLPGAGRHPEQKTGFQSETPLTRSPLTAMSQHASETQHENVSPDASNFGKY